MTKRPVTPIAATLAAAMLLPLAAAAQHATTAHPHAPTAAPAPAPAPYAGEQARTIKSLADKDMAGLLEGQGAGLAKAAELNGYPGPAHVIELRERLALSDEQLRASQALMAAHKERARALGRELVEAERRLDALFAGQRAQPPLVDAAAAEIGQLQARLRAEHLNTHLQQTALLRPAQVRAYNEARGYTGPTADGAAPAAAHGRHH